MQSPTILQKCMEIALKTSADRVPWVENPWFTECERFTSTPPYASMVWC